MQPAGTGESCLETNRSQRLLLLKQLFGIFDTGKLEEFLGAHTSPFFKQPLKMKWAKMNLPGDFIQIRLILEIFTDEADGLFDALII